MTLDILLRALGWCIVINMGILVTWCLFLAFAHDFVYRCIGKLHRVSAETFDATHYGGITFYKLVIIAFNIVPYLALRIVT